MKTLTFYTLIKYGILHDVRVFRNTDGDLKLEGGKVIKWKCGTNYVQKVFFC